MPKLLIHPHPTLDIRCGDCKFFHPDYVGDMVIAGPQGQLAAPVPVAEFIRQGQSTANMVTAKMSLCFEGPRWEHKTAEHYCSKFERPAAR